VRPSSAERLVLATKLGVGSGVWALPVTKWIVGGVLVVGGGLAVVAGGEPSSASRQRSLTAQEQTLAPVDVAPADETVPTALSSATPVETPVAVTPSAPAEARRQEPHPALVPVAPSPAKGPAPPAHAGSASPSEAQILSAARGLIMSDPKRALVLLDQHAALYPTGVLGQEREVLRVRALKQAGQMSSAEREAAEFRKEHPESAHTTDI
jgi:hypothetical protein